MLIVVDRAGAIWGASCIETNEIETDPRVEVGSDKLGHEAKAELDFMNYIFLLVSTAWASFSTFSSSFARSSFSFLAFSNSRSNFDMGGFVEFLSKTFSSFI